MSLVASLYGSAGMPAAGRDWPADPVSPVCSVGHQGIVECVFSPRLYSVVALGVLLMSMARALSLSLWWAWSVRLLASESEAQCVSRPFVVVDVGVDFDFALMAVSSQCPIGRVGSAWSMWSQCSLTTSVSVAADKV